METFPRLSCSTILIESFKLLPKNGKPMSLIALFFIVVQLGLIFSNNYFISVFKERMAPIFLPNLRPFDTRTTSPYFDTRNVSPFLPAERGFTPPVQLNPRLKRDIAIFVTVEVVFLLVTSMIAFLSGVSAIIITAASYVSQSLSIKEMFSCLWRTWTRPVVTAIYVFLLTVAYFSVVLMITAPLVIYGNSTMLALAVVFVIVSLIYYIYLSLAWLFAIVVSIVDQTSSGLKALSKAGQLIKGNRLVAFFFIAIYIVVFLIVGFFGNRVSTNRLFTTIILCLLQILFAMVNTVLYFQCKKIHDGKEIEIHGTSVYKKILNTKEVDGN